MPYIEAKNLSPLSQKDQIIKLISEIKCTLKPSKIDGIGVFALLDIKKGEKCFCIPICDVGLRSFGEELGKRTDRFKQPFVIALLIFWLVLYEHVRLMLALSSSAWQSVRPL